MTVALLAGRRFTAKKWLARLSPFFTAKEDAGCQHRLFFSQIEFCDNLIFHRRAALDDLWGAVA